MLCSNVAVAADSQLLALILASNDSTAAVPRFSTMNDISLSDVFPSSLDYALVFELVYD